MTDPAKLLLAPGTAGIPTTRIQASQWDGARRTLAASARRWSEANGFRAQPGRVLLVPDSNGAIAQVLVGQTEEADGFALASLCRTLPPGDYCLDGKSADTGLLALGWLLEAYSFSAYGKPEAPVARLVCPPGVDRSVILRAARASYLVRDLVNTPASDMGPEELEAAARAVARAHKAVLTVTSGKALEKGFPMIHAVGKASPRAPRLIDFSWGPARAPKVTLVGKGVCFDTGGISIKPAGGMEGMKGDMGGAAAVVGAMHAIAKRKAKANVVGIIGLVENMPDGNAQRPGDIVTSMSGQTIEVLNTDAEGRLVLCDAMTYVQKKFQPSAMIDLATLTGAIIISLGHDYAGLFSNDDALSGVIDAAGKASGEPVWRLPQGSSYDKLLDSPVADIKNVQASGPGSPAGSITAAQFLGRFVEPGVAWAHIDIAGTAWITGNENPLSPAWATGYGVRLLNQVVADAYEA